MSSDAFPADAMEYRLPKHELEFGVVCTLLFGGMGIVSVIVILVNADRHPVLGAVFLGFCWSCFTIPPLFFILAYFRHRLFVSPKFVRVIGCFGSREAQLVDVNNAVWNSATMKGKLVLHCARGNVTICFKHYTMQERSELIAFFRSRLAEQIQQGWKGFESRWIPAPEDYNKQQLETRRTLRFTVIAWASLIPPMYAILIWGKIVDAFPKADWLVVALLPLAFCGGMIYLMWLFARASLAETRRREDVG